MRKLFAMLLAVCACAGGRQTAAQAALPSWYTSVNAEHPRFSRTRFITAAGISTASAEDADERAKANVSAQISAQLESETTSFQRFTTAAGTTESVTSHVSVRSSFDRADLIRVVERQKEGETFYSLAALDRAATDRELAEASSADLVGFRAAAQSARKADAAQDAGVFSSAAAEASRLRQRLDASFIVRRAVLGRPSAEEAEYMTARNELLSMIARHRARRVVGVVVKNDGAGHLSDFTVNAVKRLGLRPDGAACTAREKSEWTDATELRVAPEENCSEVSLGERCEVTVRLTAQACSGGTAGAGTVSMVRAVHPSDRDKALKAAWDKVTQDAVQAAVRDALKSAIQIGE